MLTLIHRLRKEEEGQTIVLAVVAMLVLAMCVMATVNIGQATYERIRLQNTADATAYSLAATQARVFNFFAYTNRAMIAHYNTALTALSYLSYVIYLNNTIGRVMKILKLVPYLGVLAAIIEKVLKVVQEFLEYAVPLMMLAMNVLNIAYFAFQLAMLGVLYSQVTMTQPPILDKNDPDAEMKTASPLGLATKGLNTVMAHRSIDWEEIFKLFPGKHYKEVDENESRAVMTEIINAGRHPWVAGVQDGIVLIGRRWDLSFDFLGLVGIEFEKRARTEQGMRTGSEGTDKRDQAYAIETLFVSLYIRLWHWAEFNIYYASEVWADLEKGGYRERLGVETPSCCSCYKWGPCPGCGYKLLVGEAGELAEKAINEVIGALNDEKEKNLYLGVTPYMKFRPRAYQRAGFNQPDYIVAVSKPSNLIRPELSAAMPDEYSVEGWNVTSSLSSGRGTDSKIDFDIPPGSPLWILEPGFNAIAVSRAYYHRPGEWKEQPNFFNPFWGAKLHPICDYRHLKQIEPLANFLGMPFQEVCKRYLTH